MNRFFIFCVIFGSIQAEIFYESGDLANFLGGNSPSSAYDNWVSHVTEGIASEGYNDYGPNWLDVQTNGFGEHRVLEAGSPTLAYWEIIFNRLLNGDTAYVSQLLTDSLESFRYDLVIFSDTTINRTYHMLRERLDSSFVDSNQVLVEEDDVIGSFRNGWGLYILNPEASRQQMIIQVPHPCDDFIAPYVAMDLFITTDAYGFMINGTGREVAWNEIGNYNNGKSLSDPSRNENTVFQKFQEAVTEPLIGPNPHWPLVFAIHSFDNVSHAERKSVIIAAGSQNALTNKPIRDISNENFDIVNFTGEYPIPEYQFENPEPLHITEYYEAYYDDHFYYDNGSVEFPIVKATELRGPSNGVQMVALQSHFHNGSVYEPWVHVEMDEKPMLFDSLFITNETFYSYGAYPTSVGNFSTIREYYLPFIQGVEAYVSHWETYSDVTPPDSIQILYPFSIENDHITLEWLPVEDTNFKTYQIQYGQDTLTESSPFWDLNDDPDLQNMREYRTTINGINYGETWYFRIRAVDYEENAGPWSVPTTNILPGHSPPDTILSFLDTNLYFESIIDEDMDADSWVIDTLNTMPGISPTLALYGNTWKSVSIEPFLPDSETVFHVMSKIDSLSEIQAIGFSNGEQTLRYSLAGSEVLDIEEWIPVYQGTNPIGVWAPYEFPIGDDWIAWYDSLSTLTEIHFINDNDDTTESIGSVHFSMIWDLTPDLPIPPEVSIEYSQNTSRFVNNQRMVTISFNSIINDIDSYHFHYQWDFGDGNSTQEADPVHEYLIEDDHQYHVLLTVEDETRQQGWATTHVQVDEGSSSFPLTINFVGDVMMGRRLEEPGGIIPTQGVFALFEPTYEILGLAADITMANLEIPLTNQGEPHPTKSIVFRCAPENVSGLYYGGIDVVTLANNHILDYMEPGIIQTKNILNEAGIQHSGAGMNSYDAYLPAFLSAKGQTIAVIASSDRTGQYNNYQPYLNAGENKSGFAYLTPYYLRQQIQSVRTDVDLVVVEMHAGSEYSSAPGENYDSYEPPPTGFENLRTNPASEIGFMADPLLGLDEEDYSPRLDRPKMWDRAIRQFAIDEGADAVIVHHPHIIHGVEIYDGKIIAHSLGNFIFDLDYPETYPSMILNGDADETGFTGFSITPLYIDDYLTVPATGELGNYILDYIAMRSRELDTYVHVNKETSRAYVVMDTLAMTVDDLEFSSWVSNWTEMELQGETFFTSNPIPIPDAGSLAEISTIPDTVTHYRLGREKIWMKNFENEGSTLWNFNSESEFIQDSVYRRGAFAATHLRDENSDAVLITNLEERILFKNEFEHSIHGFIKTENGYDVTLQARLYEGRTSPPLITSSLKDSVNGTMDWFYYWENLSHHEDAQFFDIRLHSGVPDSGVSESWFDDVGVIEWDSIRSISNFPIPVNHPNDYNYIQLIANQQPGTVVIQSKNGVIGDLGLVESVPRSTTSRTTAPGTIHFFDESRGPVGSWNWEFGDESTSPDRHPSHLYENPGIYSVMLTVSGLNGEMDEAFFTIVMMSEGEQEHDRGDVNGDGFLTMVDVILCANYIMGTFDFTPEEFLAADVDGNGIVDVFDVLGIADLTN